MSLMWQLRQWTIQVPGSPRPAGRQYPVSALMKEVLQSGHFGLLSTSLLGFTGLPPALS